MKPRNIGLKEWFRCRITRRSSTIKHSSERHYLNAHILRHQILHFAFHSLTHRPS